MDPPADLATGGSRAGYTSPTGNGVAQGWYSELEVKYLAATEFTDRGASAAPKLTDVHVQSNKIPHNKVVCRAPPISAVSRM